MPLLKSHLFCPFARITLKQGARLWLQLIDGQRHRLSYYAEKLQWQRLAAPAPYNTRIDTQPTGYLNRTQQRPLGLRAPNHHPEALTKRAKPEIFY